MLCNFKPASLQFMRRSYNLPLIFLLTILATVLCGCPPRHAKILVRNRSIDTARLFLIYKTPFDSFSRRELTVRATNEIVPVKMKNLSRVNDTLIASAEGEKIMLIVPPTSTVFVSDLLTSTYMFYDKSLVIEYAGKSDTMTFNYPYKHLPGFKSRYAPPGILIYYDIRTNHSQQ